MNDDNQSYFISVQGGQSRLAGITKDMNYKLLY